MHIKDIYCLDAEILWAQCWIIKFKVKLHFKVDKDKVRRTPIMGVDPIYSDDGVGCQGSQNLIEDFLGGWASDGEKKGAVEASGLLFEAIPGALEGPIFHEVVHGVFALLASTDLGNIGK